jgi:hypothetical protein
MSSPFRALTPLLVFALALALLAGFGLAYEVPAPYVHDEFGYLLSADTFVQGRLTNPTHPLSVFFESFHVFFEPTYQSKYPPAQGLFLALGELLWDPILGVWLTWAAALAATCWMLRAVLPAGWALLGTALLLLNPYLFLIWGQSYWGGAVAAAGGALIFGSLLHARSRSSLVDGVALATGLFLLGNSRPFEGILTGLFAFAMLAYLLRRGWFEGRWPELVRRVLVPGALGLLAFVVWTMYYDWRVTGNPFQMPYFTYHPELSVHEDIRSYTGSPERSFAGKSLRLVDGLLGRPLAIVFPFLFLRRREPFVLLAALISYAVGMVVLAGSRAWPHYVAPVTCLIAFLCATSLRAVGGLRMGRTRVGLAALAFVLLLHGGWWLQRMDLQRGVHRRRLRRVGARHGPREERAALRVLPRPHVLDGGGAALPAAAASLRAGRARPRRHARRLRDGARALVRRACALQAVH